MGLGEYYAKRGYHGGNRPPTSTGFSTNKYFSRNAASATNWTPPRSGGGGGGNQPPDTRRPYQGMGKFNVNLMGRPQSPPSEQLQAKPGGFEGVPVLGGLAGLLGEAAKMPLGFIPGIGQTLAMGEMANKALASEYIKTRGADYAAFAAQQQAMGETDVSKMQVAFMKQQQLKEDPKSKLTSNLLNVPEATAGGLAMGLLNTLNAGSQLVQRGLSGFGGIGIPGQEPLLKFGGGRLKDLSEASDAELENNAELISIRDRYNSGDLKGKDDETLDELTLVGAAISNPLGQSDWANSIRNAAKGTPFQLPAEVVANVSAAAVSLGLEVVTDPLTLISFGAGSAVKIAGKGIGKTLLRYTDDAARLAIEEAEKVGGKALTKAEAEVLTKGTREAAMNRLYETLPKGVEASEMNMVEYGLKAGVPGLKEATSAAGFAKPLVNTTHALRWISQVENSLDPLTLFGRGVLGKASTKMASIQIVDGVLDSLDRRAVASVYDLLKTAGVDIERVGGDLGTASANVSSQVGGELTARMYARMGIGVEDAADPVALANLGQDMLARQGNNIRSLAKHKMEKVRHVVRATGDETQEQAVARERTHAADLLTRMYGIDESAALKATAGMSENELGVVRMLGYGNRADGLLNARTVARKEAIDAGLDPSFADRFIFLAENQLSRGKAKQLIASVRAKDYATMRASITQYDTLDFNLSQNMSDKELAKATLEVIHDMWEHLPQEVPEANLSPAMKAFRDQHGDIEVGLRPEEVFATGKNHEGRITSVNPFMDYIRGKSIDIGDVPPPNVVQQWQQRLLGSISGSQVMIEQSRRFNQRMAIDTGMTRNQSDSVLRLIRQKASEVGASSARGLSRDDIYQAASQVRLSKRTREQMTERQLQMAVFWAYEGSYSKVGLSQKFTGKLKSMEVNRLGTSGLGLLAERLYPNVRFKYNPMFLWQEMWETPILLTARGMLSPGQFVGTADVALSRVQARAAEGIAGGAKRMHMDDTLPRQLAGELREKANVKQAEYDELAHQTALMMDAFSTNSAFSVAMQEGADVARWGSAAAQRMANGHHGQMLTKLKNDSNMNYIKTRGQTVAFRRTIGDHMAATVFKDSPAQWLAIKHSYGTLDDGEAGVRLFNDYLARVDPDSALSAISGLHNPGEFIRPSFLGARTRFSTRVVEDVLGKDMPGNLTGKAMGVKDIRAAYMDPANPHVNDVWLEDTMRAAGADEWYIERTKWHLGGYQTVDEYKKGLMAFMDESEANAIMMHHAAVAKAEGVPLLESLADKYAGSPKVLDETGKFKGNTLFQLIADATEARGLRTVARDDPILDAYREIGQSIMPNLSMPDSHKVLAWEGSALAKHTELVPLRKLIDVAKGNEAVRLSPAQRRDLAQSLKNHGMQEPVQLTYHHQSSTVELGEGNHRVDILRLMTPEAKWDTTMVPVTVFSQVRSKYPRGTPVKGKVADANGYVPNNLRPSDIGFVGRGEAEYARNEATRDIAVGKLSDAQKKGRKAQRIRADREANPQLGLPMKIEGGTLVAYGKDGRVMHRMGPGKTPEQWVEELKSTMTDTELAEHADWYLDMRRGFLALNDNKKEEAVQLLMAFGVTQLNTSPVDGMRFLLRTSERLRSGWKLSDIAKEEGLKVSGLNAVSLNKLLDEKYLASEGLGFKLIDFVDSLIGNPTRTIPVSGPNGRWGPVAGDIWAKRDMGYVDAKMLKHLQHAYGEAWDITPVKGRAFNKESGEYEEVTRSFTMKNKETGEVRELPESMVGGNPTDHEYDAIVEFYNNAVDHLNTIKFLGRQDWTAPEAQALGWFKAKRVFGDDTGDPRSAFFDNAWHVAQEVSPSRNSVASAIYPQVMEETSRGIAAHLAYPLGDEAAHLSGVSIISMNGGVRGRWDPGATKGRLSTTVNYEIMASPEGAESFLASIGALAQQGDVRATRATKTKPTAKNNVRHAVEIRFPASIDKEEMYAILKQRAETNEFFADADIVRAADGTHVVRVAARKGETQAQFKARMNDVELRQFYNEHVSPEGYGRGRYVNPDDPMNPGLRETEIRARGEALVTDSQADNLPLDYWAENTPSLTDDLYTKTRDEWGGDTIDLKSGSRPKAKGEKKGGGPYATAIATTKKLDPGASKEEFAAALDEFVAENKVLLEQGHHLGVFNNKDTGNIEFDVNMIVEEFKDAEAVQLFLKREGGAYDFTTGKGVFAPIFDKNRTHGVERTYAEVIEASNDWKAQPDGKGYLDILRTPAKEDRYVRERAAGELEREGIHWGRMVYEDAYQSVAAREVAAHRATARELGDDVGFDLDNPAGYLQSSPRGTRGTIVGAGDGRRGNALFQRASPGAKPRGAITDAGTTLSETGRRSQVYVSPKRKVSDTIAHEYAHDWVNRNLHPSAIRRIKDMYAGRSGTPPTIGSKSRNAKLTVDEHEWVADQLVEYLRTGDIEDIPLVLRPLAAHYSTTLKANRRRPKLSAEAKGLFDSMDKVAIPKNAANFDVDEQSIIKHMYSAHMRADRMSADLVHFKTERSWMERTMNHPYFGLYPLSYMWGKVLPEMVEFLAFRPFGMKAPLVGANMVNQMYQHVMLQMENDPDLKKFMEDNEDAFRAISMMVPGLPWDLPVNAPLWLRRYVEAAATNIANDQAGKKPEDYETWQAFVQDIDFARTAGDVIGYTYGPRAGTESLLEYPGLAADLVTGMKPNPDEPVTSGDLPPVTDNSQQVNIPNPESSVPATQPTFPSPPQPTNPGPGESDIEELQAILGDQYEEVAARISE